jgi:hypothetical protein
VKSSALVTDVNLKGQMKGWDICAQIHPEFPVIYMTGAAADAWASKDVPNSILLRKPFAPVHADATQTQLDSVVAAAGHGGHPLDRLADNFHFAHVSADGPALCRRPMLPPTPPWSEAVPSTFPA